MPVLPLPLIVMRLRPVPLALGVLLVAAVTTSIVHRSWISAQVQATVVLSTTLETPVLTWVVRKLTGEPHVEETAVAGVPTTLVRPDGDGPWPAFVFLNGATELGRAHPDVQRLARGLARAGFLVLVPDLPGLVNGELTDAMVAKATELGVAAANRPDSTGRVALFGASLGATIALLAAERDELAGRVSVVVGIAPYTDLVNVIRLATTGYTRVGAGVEPYGSAPFLALAVARSVAAGLPQSPARDRLISLLADVRSDDPDPLARLRDLEVSDPTARAGLGVLLNRDPERFETLYAALPDDVRDRIEALSPITNAARLQMPVELASAPHDAYFPAAESHNLALVAPDVRVTVTDAFTHVIPEPSLTDPGDLFAFDGWAVHALHAARR